MSRDEWRRVFVIGSMASALMAFSGSAAASPTFPPIVQDAVGVECPPECTICHIDNAGGLGRLSGNFVQIMRDIGGLQAAQPQTVVPAIDTLRMLAEMNQTAVDVDSDDDGIDDISALAQGLNPSTGERFCGADGGMAAGPGPVEYGCFNRVAPRGPAGAGAVGVLGMLLGLAALGRRRRRTKQER